MRVKTNLTNSLRLTAGFSLVEAIIVIAVIGIISSIALPSYNRIREGSRKVVAGNILDALNKATKEFAHSQYDLRTTPVPSSGGDELLILRTLQWRNPNTMGELNFPGPYMRNDWNPKESSSDEDYRVEWTGSAWRLITPGNPGAGLQILFDGTDLGTPYVHSADFTPAASR